MVSLCLTMLPLHPMAQESTMYDQAEFSYGLSVRARNMVVRFYINGAPVAFHSSLREMSYYASVARYLRAGTNTIVIDYEPIDPVERSFTPTPDMQVFVELDQSRKSVRQGRIDVFHGQFDTERPELASLRRAFADRRASRYRCGQHGNWRGGHDRAG
jgi:hypothetical protein